jgi:hypothetical protein
MKQAETQAALLIWISMLKALSEHHTLISDIFRQSMKQDINSLVRRMDEIIKKQESNLSPEGLQMLEGITDVYHNINIEIRNGAVSKYEQLDK